MRSLRRFGPLVVVATLLVGVTTAHAQHPTARPTATPDLARTRHTADSLAAQAPKSLLQVGRADAPLVIEDFSDMQCPACAGHDAWNAKVLDEYVAQGLVRVIYYDLPLKELHMNAMDGAMLVHCANEQGKALATRHALFASQAQWGTEEAPRAAFGAILAPLGIDTAKVLACYDRGPYVDVIQWGLREATRRQVPATPSLYFGGHMLVGAYPPARFRLELDRALGRAPAAPVVKKPSWKDAETRHSGDGPTPTGTPE
jgi:protein-disulfide isomerase